MKFEKAVDKQDLRSFQNFVSLRLFLNEIYCLIERYNTAAMEAPTKGPIIGIQA